MVNASTMMASAQTQGGSPWTFGHCWPPVTQIKHDYLEKKKKEQEKKKRQHKKENTMPFGINLMRSQVLYWAAYTTTYTIARAVFTRPMASVYSPESTAMQGVVDCMR